MKTSYYSLAPNGLRLKFPRRTIRFVQRDVRLQSFHHMFSDIVKNARKCWKDIEAKPYVNILKLLDRIIPDQFFGVSKHRALFYDIVKLILTSSVYECIYVDRILHRVDLHKVPWLQIFHKDEAMSKELRRLGKRYFFEAQLWLLDKIVKPLIFRFYAPVRRGKSHELDFVPRRLWMSFQTKVFNHLYASNYLSKTDPNLKPRGLLQIKPKAGYKNFLEFRPIMRLYASEFPKTTNIKETIKKIRLAAQNICKTKTNSLFQVWKEYTSVNSGPIFAAKIDIADAFGNINIHFLCYILRESSELNKISSDISNIINHVQNQVICFGKTKTGTRRIYRWHHGLLQGDRFSSVLCQFYLSYLDSIHLKSLYKEDTFIHRTVDDYFFCSTHKDDVEEFITIMTSVHQINRSKTYSNLEGYGHNVIPYCGHSFILDKKQVTGLHNFKKRYEIRHNFCFWNLRKPIYHKQKVEKTIQEFLLNPMNFRSNSFNFKNLELNTIFNDETTVMNNYFESMIRLAFKFDACVMSIYYKIKNFSIVTRIIKVVVHKYARKTITILNHNHGCNGTELLSFGVFLKLGFQAFQLVFKKRTQYQKHEILEVLSKQVKKISCVRIDFKRFRSVPRCFNTISGYSKKTSTS